MRHRVDQLQRSVESGSDYAARYNVCPAIRTSDALCMNPLALSEEEYRQVSEPIAFDYRGAIGERACYHYVPRSGGLNHWRIDGLKLQIPRWCDAVGCTWRTLQSTASSPCGLVCEPSHTAADVEAVVDEVLMVGKELSSGAQS